MTTKTVIDNIKANIPNMYLSFTRIPTTPTRIGKNTRAKLPDAPNQPLKNKYNVKYNIVKIILVKKIILKIIIKPLIFQDE